MYHVEIFCDDSLCTFVWEGKILLSILIARVMALRHSSAFVNIMARVCSRVLRGGFVSMLQKNGLQADEILYTNHTRISMLENLHMVSDIVVYVTLITTINNATPLKCRMKRLQ